MVTRRCAQWLLLLVFVCNSAFGTIHIVALGQEGSAAIIIQEDLPGKPVILVDAGKASASAARGGARVLAKLCELKIKHVDLAIFSHVDNDHFGGYRNLLDTIKMTPGRRAAVESQLTRGPPVTFGKVIEPGFEPPQPQQAYETFKRVLKERGITRVTRHEVEALKEIESEYGIKLFAMEHPTTKNDSSILVSVKEKGHRT